MRKDLIALVPLESNRVQNEENISFIFVLQIRQYALRCALSVFANKR